MGWIRALILVCASIGLIAAQKPSVPTLQLGTPIERTIATGQSHTYQIVAEENSLVQITIEQRGIDVVVRVLHPLGKKPSEYDSPTGADGTEDVSFVTASKTPYLIERSEEHTSELQSQSNLVCRLLLEKKKKKKK